MPAREDDDPGQTRAIDGWIVKVLTRGGVPVIRMRDGSIGMAGVPQKWAAIIDALSAGIHAAARGEELPDLTPAPIKHVTRIETRGEPGVDSYHSARCDCGWMGTRKPINDRGRRAAQAEASKHRKAPC